MNGYWSKQKQMENPQLCLKDVLEPFEFDLHQDFNEKLDMKTIIEEQNPEDVYSI